MSEQDYILIREYLNNELEPIQLEEVKRRMASDEVFNKTVKSFDLLMRGKQLQKEKSIKDDTPPFEVELSERLDSYYESINDESEVNIENVPKSNSWLKIAATISILMLSSVWIYTSWFDISPMDELISGYAKEYMEVPSGRGIADEWKVNYKEKNYNKVIAILSLKEDISNEEAFYLGLSYLYKENYKKAVELLSDASLLKSNFSNHSLWYLSLAYYLNGNEEESIELLMDFKNDTYNHYNDAAGDAIDQYEDQD